MMLSALFGGVIVIPAAPTKKITISNTDDCQLPNLVNSAASTYCWWGVDAAVHYGGCI
jgi:hypothetical protein